MAAALPICAQGRQAKVTRAQMGTSRTGPVAESRTHDGTRRRHHRREGVRRAC
ncbi:MAG: hypothetical protein M0C28_18160 [Candidatus Moduliflexus flocculans]|nr:hypothetical protein [Candidatus Moduliflexus flocculans]